MSNSNDIKAETKTFFQKYRQQILYFSFAVAMIALNYTIQWFNYEYISIWVENHLGHIGFIQTYYLAKTPYDMTELVGSIVAVGVTYIEKFLLDKFVVFEKKEKDLKQTSKEFSLYFVFAIITTLENIGIQFILSNFLGSPMILSLIIALTIGYITKFFLDRKYVFRQKENNS
jgi:putative flippase GtrA